VARALIKKPKILLLDEATSAMDQAAVDALLRTIRAYRADVGNLTVVMVAFRIVTFKTMDKIATLRKDGTIGPVGTHEELLQ
jgi:ATP-binding cassette subfamily B protein